MSDGQFISDTLEAFIVGMAESLRDAQSALDAAPARDNSGRPTTRYAIPHLDFEMNFDLSTVTSETGKSMLRFSPVSSKQQTRTISSTVKGRFLAVPSGDGLPLPVLDISVSGEGARREIDIAASNTAGEPLAGVGVEINFDKEVSKALSEASGVTVAKAGQIVLANATPVTDENGMTSTTITLAQNLARNAKVVISIELGLESRLIVLTKAG